MDKRLKDSVDAPIGRQTNARSQAPNKHKRHPYPPYLPFVCSAPNCPVRREPPRLEDCSPDGPIARHMAVEAAETDIDLGYFRRRGRRSAGSGTAAAAAADSGEVEQEYHRLLREPVDVTVSVKTVSPSVATAAAAAAGAEFDGGQATELGGGEASGSRGGGAGEVCPPPPGSSSTGSGGDDDDAEIAEEAVEEEAEKTIKVRVEVPRLLRLSLSADARAALARCVGGNILAAGFQGEASENFPLRAAAPPEGQEEGGDGAASNRGGSGGGGGAEESEADDMEYEGEKAQGGRASQAGGHVAGASRETGQSGLQEGGAASAAAAAGRARPPVPAYGAGDAQHQHQRRQGQGHRPGTSPSPTRSPPRGPGGAESRCPVASECPLCAGAFDELLARHECALCGGTVCRRCMHTQVSFFFFFFLVHGTLLLGRPDPLSLPTDR